LSKIIFWLLNYIQIQRKIIIYLLVLLTCKNIYTKSKVPISKKYQTMIIDKMPIIERLEKLDYKLLLSVYKDKNGKELKPIKRRKKSNVPITLTCPRCDAPHDYLYDNTGGRGQFKCKICDYNFNYKNYYSKDVIIKCPYCGKTLAKIKKRKDFNILKCCNNSCLFYVSNLASMSKAEKKIYIKEPYRLKLRYIYRQFTYDYKPLSESSPDLPKVDISKIHSSPHTLGLILTYYANYGMAARRTAAIMQDIHNVKISHQTVLNYAQTVSKFIKPYVDNYPYELSDSFCGDETYLKIKGKWQYLFFFFDAVKKIILSYRISPNRDTLSAIKALDDVLKKMDSIPDDLSFVVDGNPIYVLAQHFFAQNGIYFDINQVIGLTNKDKVSKEHRPLKQIVERLNRTFKREYKTKYGFKSSAGSESFTILFVAYFNFLRPHSALEKKVPVVIPELDNSLNMPAKWLILIDLAQEYIQKETENQSA